MISPLADAAEITQAISERGAIRLTPVECKQTGDAQQLLVTCGTKRRVVYPDGNNQDESFGGMFEYTPNANGTYTRIAWECPIL